MAIILSNDLITMPTAYITVQSTASGFDKKNVFILDNLKRRWRMDSLDTSFTNPIMVIDMLSTRSVAALFLDNVNFDTVQIKGHASDLGTDWSGASFSKVLNTYLDDQTNRYKIFYPFNGFNYRYLALIVPPGTSAVGSYTSKWEISRIGIMDSILTFTHDMAPGYERGNDQGFVDLELASKRRNRRVLGEHFWVGVLHFGYRTETQEADLTTLNNYDMDDVLVFWENNGDYSKAYFCMRDDSYIGTVEMDGVVKGSSIRLQEMP